MLLNNCVEKFKKSFSSKICAGIFKKLCLISKTGFTREYGNLCTGDWRGERAENIFYNVASFLAQSFIKLYDVFLK